MWFEMRKESLGFVERAPAVHVAEGEVRAARAAVFAALVDLWGWKSWFPNVREASYTSPPPYGVGTIREARGRGATRVVDVIARGMRYIATSEPYRAFVERDPQRALRIVASKDGPVQRRTIALHEELLEEEVRRGALRLPVDAHTMAYALVRVVESFLYADAVAGEQVDLEKAVAILKLMLR